MYGGQRCVMAAGRVVIRMRGGVEDEANAFAFVWRMQLLSFRK